MPKNPITEFCKTGNVDSQQILVLESWAEMLFRHLKDLVERFCNDHGFRFSHRETTFTVWGKTGGKVLQVDHMDRSIVIDGTLIDNPIATGQTIRLIFDTLFVRLILKEE